METKIRFALESEREAIARCIAEGFERDFSLFSKDTDKVTAALVPGIVPRRFYVAERRQEIVGVAGISDSTERAVYTDARALRINFGFWKGMLAKLVLKLEFEGRLILRQLVSLNLLRSEKCIAVGELLPFCCKKVW